MLKEAIRHHNWVKDLNVLECLTVGHLQEFLEIWTLAQEVHLQQDTDDQVAWKLSPSGLYSTASAYRAQFMGSTSCNLRQLI